jgi:outer membrane protein assembly factor BamB
MLRFWRLAVVFTLGASMAAVSAQTLAEPDLRLWRVDLPGKARDFVLTASGLVVVASEQKLAAFDIEAGKPAWEMDLPDASLLGYGSDRYVVSSGKRVIGVDTKAGKALWTVESLPLTSVTELYKPSDSTLLVMGPADEKTFRVVGVDIAGGRVLWQDDTIAAGDGPKAKDVFVFSRRAVLPDSSAVLQFNRGGIVRFDLASGKVLWRVDTKAKPAFTLGWPAASGFEAQKMLMTPQPLVSGNFLVTTTGAIDIRTGAIAWRMPEKPAGWTSSLVDTPSGVLIVRATKFDQRTVQLADPATGRVLWTTPPLKGNAPLLLRGDTVWVGVDRGLASFPLSTGAPVKSMTLPDFASGDEPTSVSSIGTGDLLLESSANLMRVAPTGSVVFHRSFGVPRVGVRPLMGLTIPDMLNPGGLKAFHTDDADSLGQKGLVLLNPETGDELGTVRRKDRAPVYAIAAAKLIGVGLDARTLTGYRFAPPPGSSSSAPPPK